MESHLLCCLSPHSLPFLFFFCQLLFSNCGSTKNQFFPDPRSVHKKILEPSWFSCALVFTDLSTVGHLARGGPQSLPKTVSHYMWSRISQQFCKKWNLGILGNHISGDVCDDGLQRQKRGWYSERGRGEEKGERSRRVRGSGSSLFWDPAHICPLHSMAKILLIPF